MSAPATARTSPASARSATEADAERASQTLGRAFADDPLICFFLPDVAARPLKMPKLFKLLFELGLPHGACDVTEGFESVALWRPPGKWHIPFSDYIVKGPQFLGIFGLGGLSVMGAMDRIEKVHPREPHYYLQAVGTDPAMQGKGFGGVVMRRQLAIADSKGMPAYLESSKESNIPIYQSLGFELTGEIKVPGGPTLYPMWRKARP